MPSLSRLSESGWPSNVGPFQLWTFGVLFFDNQIDLNKYGLVLYWARWLVYPTQFCLLQLAMVLQCPIWRNDHGSFNWKCRILNRRPPPRKAPCTELHALSYNPFPMWSTFSIHLQQTLLLRNVSMQVTLAGESDIHIGPDTLMLQLVRTEIAVWVFSCVGTLGQHLLLLSKLHHQLLDRLTLVVEYVTKDSTLPIDMWDLRKQELYLA